MPGISLSMRERILESEIGEMPEEIQQRYRNLREEGETVVVAHMLATQQAPVMGNSDRAFNEHHRRKMSTMREESRQRIVDAARRAGIDTEGKYYMSGLGRYTDPAAWVSTVDDAIGAARAKNLNMEINGRTVTEADLIPPKQGPRLAPDLVQELKQRYMAKDPALAEKVRKSPKESKELEQTIIEKHGRPKES